MYIQKSMNKFQGMSAPAQLSDAPKGKQWEQHQRIKEGEEGWARTMEFGNEITQRREAKERQKKAEEDEKMERFIARQRAKRKEDLENAETQSRINKNYRIE